MEEEDRQAQSAKLQELIRRGTPRDLAAAQELMKSLAGANPDAKPDYRSQALTDLNKLEQKVILLNEMLDNVDSARGERFVEGDAYDVKNLHSFPFSPHKTHSPAFLASLSDTGGRSTEVAKVDIRRGNG